jgi:hypothetical protein
MKLIIRAEHGSSDRPNVLSTVPLKWDVSKKRFVMLRAVSDGFYDLEVETSVIPLELDIREDALHILVQTGDDLTALEDALKQASAICQKSYLQSRT